MKTNIAFFTCMSDNLVFTFDEKLQFAYNFAKDTLKGGFDDKYQMALENAIKEVYKAKYAQMGAVPEVEGELMLQVSNYDYSQGGALIDITDELRWQFTAYDLTIPNALDPIDEIMKQVASFNRQDKLRLFKKITAVLTEDIASDN